jgi:large repetitive protein
MKCKFTLPVVIVFLASMFLGAQMALGQTGVLNPNDTVFTYNPASPPKTPANNVLVKWVRTVDFSYSTTDFKCYFFDGMAFRLKWPANYNPNQSYPLYVFFHGVGEKGTTLYDNEQQLFHGGQLMQQAVNNGTYNGFLMYPQNTTANGGWSTGDLTATATLIQNYFAPQLNVDLNRVTISGLSGGGDAAWTFIETYPLICADGWIMSSSSVVDQSYANLLRFTPIWMFTGGLDNDPTPYTSNQMAAVYNKAGADLINTIETTQGHDTWDSSWNETGYFPFINAAHKANPWTLTGQNQFCPGTTINATIGVMAGFQGYQWRKNGTIISGANADTLVVNSVGIYDCSIERGTTWSVFSPHPDTISYLVPSAPPTITVNGLMSDVVPAPNGATSTSLMVPANYSAYVWQRIDSPATLSSTTNILTGATPGTYEVKVTGQYGCSANFTNPFIVESASGPNPPSPVSNFLATTLSQTQIRLNWTEVASQTYPETQFEIYQGNSINGPYQLVGFAPAFVDSFVVTGLGTKTQYYFKVRPINSTAAAATSNASSAQTQADVTAPAAPGSLAVVNTSTSTISLAWNQATDNVGVVSYDIYMNGLKLYSQPSSASSPDTTYTATSLVNGNTYNFVVRARDLAGNVSAASNQATAIAAFSGLNYNYYNLTTTPGVLPNFPTLTPTFSGNMPNVSIGNATSTTNFAYIWNGYINIPVTGNYVFQTVSDDGSEVWLGGLNQTAFPYSFTTKGIVVANQPQGATATNSATQALQAGVYPISIAYFQAGGGYSMVLNWSTPSSGGSFVAVPSSAFVQLLPPAGNPPAVPTNLTATAVSSKKVTLTWQDTATNATGFQVFRAASAAGPYVAAGTVPASKTTFSDSTLTAATTYYYQVDAINNYGSSGYNVIPGGNLTVNYYALSSAPSVLPNFSTLTPTSTFTDTTFAINFTNAGTNWAATYTGFIVIPTTGTYTFNTNSDDGSALYIDGVEVVNNDGLHGGVTVTSTATLTAGVHRIQGQFFQAGGGQQFSAQISGPGIALQNIPSKMLGLPPISVTTLAAPVIPAAPSGLMSYVVTSNKVGLTWVVNDTNAIKYQVWRSPVTDANYLLDTTLSGKGITSYLDSNLTQTSVYYYKVLALNEGGSSAFSNEIGDTTLPNPLSTVIETAPASISLHNDTTETFNLSATSNYGTLITFASSNLPAFATLTAGANNTATLTLKPSSFQLGTYNIALTATDNFGSTVTDSVPISVTGNNQDIIDMNINSQFPQGAPWNNITANPTAGLTVSNLKDVSGNTTTVSIVNVSPWSANRTGAQTGNNSGIYPDNVMLTFYYGTSAAGYQMYLTGLSQNKKYSLIFFAGYPWTPAQLAAQGPLLCTYTANGQTVTLNAANNTSQIVQISGLSPDNTGRITFTCGKPTGSPFDMLGALQIISYDAIVAPTTLLPPTNLSAYGTSPSKIALNWTGSTDVRTGYEVWRSTSPVGTYTRIATPAANATSYVDSTLTPNSTYFYEVREVVQDTLYSAFTSYAGGSTVAFVANLNWNGSASFAENNGQWNNFNTIISAGYSLPNLTNTLGQNTGITFNLIRNTDGYNSGIGVTTGNNSGVVPDSVMKKGIYYSNFGDSMAFTLTGLPMNTVYNLTFYAGEVNYTGTTTYRVGSQIATLNPVSNTTLTATLYNLVPDATGTITVYIGSSVGFGFIDATIISGMTLPGTIAADSTGGGGIATYLATQAGLMTGDASIMSASTSDSLSTTTATAIGAYPNPFVDQVTVSTTFTDNVSKLAIVLVDMSGHILQVNQFSNVYAGQWQETLNMSNVPPGVYKLELIGVPGEKPRIFTVVKYK